MNIRLISPRINAGALRRFFGKRLLKDEMGIEDWSDSTLRNMATVANNCDSSVIDALLSGEFILREAKLIAPLPKETQRELLELFKKNRSEYNSRFQEIKEANKKTPKVTHADTRRTLKASLKHIKAEQEAIKKYASQLGPKYNRNELDAIKKIESFIEALEELIENTK